MNLVRYRRAFREKIIPSYYSARVHIFLFALFQIIAILYFGLKIEWNPLSPIFILLSWGWASFALYWVHRILLHQKIPGFGWAFRMHRWHHTFYQDHKMEYDELNDVYMLLMPPWLQLIYFLFYLPLISFVLSFFISEMYLNHFIFSLILWYGLYEVVHWSEHLPDNHRLMKLRFVRKMKDHHIVHHDQKLMDDHNFGIIEPTQDYIWKTRG